eukprot:CAMPEP_0202688912 /NCGR_PEP_ID=MMETSP1385-20130828/4293_1 /ASSEMBLY_ACC=CAM_ASM_000861 /TAXON_ID=933848 /ORGANISM="Elphidium margaritaceum" /LENGTH=188 /DNA_ID=CAMNT_0049343965 /DNA_START=22 /DNA_END=585 /DNA_ORIENTATION=+
MSVARVGRRALTNCVRRFSSAPAVQYRERQRQYQWRDRGNIQQQRNKFVPRWRLPETDEDLEIFLMRWENVTGNDFLTSMRERVIKYGTVNMSEKQKQAVRNCVAHPSTGAKRALYPRYYSVDPIMKRLLLLNKNDLDYAISQNKEHGEALKKLSDQLKTNGTLSYKQLKFSGSLLWDFFGDEENKTE